MASERCQGCNLNTLKSDIQKRSSSEPDPPEWLTMVPSSFNLVLADLLKIDSISVSLMPTGL